MPNHPQGLVTLEADIRSTSATLAADERYAVIKAHLVRVAGAVAGVRSRAI